MKQLIVLLAHGSKDQRWSDHFSQLTKEARKNSKDVRLAFMELSTPSIDDIFKQAHEEQYSHAKVIPLFLAVGRHLRLDIPKMLEKAEQDYQIKIELLPPIGEHAILFDAVTKIAMEHIETP